jgi:hypothetical protein
VQDNGKGPTACSLFDNMMSSTPLENSLIPEGRINRDDAVEKLHLSYLSGVTPEYLASLPFDEFEAAADQVVGLFSSGFARIRVTHHKWLMYGFNCASTSASGDHRNANPTAQIKRDAGWHFRVSGLSCDATDIAAEHAKAFEEGEKRRKYQADFTEALGDADASFRDLMRKVWEMKGRWGEEQQGNHAEDLINVHQGTQVLGDSGDFDKFAKLEELIADACKLHEVLVDMVLRFLPGRTFLKS